MRLLHCRLVQRFVCLLVSAGLVASGTAGCATAARGQGYAWIEGVAVDGQRLAGPGDGGMASITRDGRTVEARAGMELRRGDVVTTGPRAEAVIRYASGSQLYMRQNSSGRIGSLLGLIGEVFAKIKGRFEVETTFVRAGAQGTAYLVRAAPDGEASVVVFEGTVRVDSTQRAWAPVTIGAGQMVVAQMRPPQPMPATVEELQATRAWVERLERLVPPPASISSTEAAIAAAAVAVAVGAIIASRNRSRDSAPPPTPAPTGTGDAAAGTRAGTDAKKAQETAPRPLGAPTGLAPGSARAPIPLLNCNDGATLTWNRVDGARDYVYRLESTDKPGQWPGGAPTATAATSTKAFRSQLKSSNRWSVQARDGGRTGTASPWFYFNCSFGAVIR